MTELPILYWSLPRYTDWRVFGPKHQSNTLHSGILLTCFDLENCAGIAFLLKPTTTFFISLFVLSHVYWYICLLLSSVLWDVSSIHIRMSNLQFEVSKSISDLYKCKVWRILVNFHSYEEGKLGFICYHM